MLEAGHGRVSGGWRVEGSLQPWRVGKPLADVFGSASGAAAAVDGLEAAELAKALADPPTLEGSSRRVRVGEQVFDVLGFWP